MSERVEDLVAAFEAGRLSRDGYWSAMQDHHRALRGYQGLVRGPHLEAIEIRHDGLYVRLREGFSMRWHPEDLRTAPSVLVNDGVYEPDELALLSRLTKGAKVVLDVGANVGWYALHLAQSLQERGGRIYAFEPVPTTYSELLGNLAINGVADVITPVHVALGDTNGEVTFFVPETTGSVAASQRPLFPGDENRRVTCPIRPLDDWAKEQRLEHVDLIKCDVEGAEIFVLRGGRQTIAQHRPVLMLEMLRKWARAYEYHPNDIIRLLAEYGYTCWAIQGHSIHRFEAISEECTETNFFFLHSSKHADLLDDLQNWAPVGGHA